MTTYNLKIIPVFAVELKDGKMTMVDSEESRYTKFLLSNEGKYLLTLKKPVRRRSTPQNAWYWACVLPIIADYIGEEDLEEVDRLMESQHLRTQVSVKGKMYTKVGRCSKLNSHDFGEYVERVRMWASKELGCAIPDPDKEYLAHELKAEIDAE